MITVLTQPRVLLSQYLSLVLWSSVQPADSFCARVPNVAVWSGIKPTAIHRIKSLLRDSVQVPSKGTKGIDDRDGLKRLSML
jgi:hypothetical protein